MFIRSITITFILAVFLPQISAGQNKTIAITIDDLPCTTCETLDESVWVTDKIVGILDDFGVPAIGFVNESKLYSAGGQDSSKINLLKRWLDAGLDLGNHTFSHVFINNTSLTDYQADILRGEAITRPLMHLYDKELRFFRHTQLRTGPTLVYQNGLDAFLTKHNYTVAPVTMDNDEYLYARAYHNAISAGDSVKMRLIGFRYIAHMKAIFNHYERLSQSYLGRQIPQILLLHANEINADYLDVLLTILRRRNYNFISLDEALTDSIYQKETGVHQRGISWIDRWRIADGLEISDQPDPHNIESISSQNLVGNQEDLEAILSNINAFSDAYINQDYDAVANAYTENGKIFPNNADIIEGKKDIRARWVVPSNQTIIYHQITPVEIVVEGETAYDYGFYAGETRYRNGNTNRWFGKYVIVWKKVAGEWKMYLDIWNNL